MTRKARAALRRDRLLEVALALFTERGYRGTSVRDITRAAGVTEAVLYHYFANKADLWAAVLDAYTPFGSLKQILEGVATDPLDVALQRVGIELLGLLRSREQLVLTLLSEAPVEPDVARVLERFLNNVAVGLAAFLAARLARGEVAEHVDVAAAARAFQGALFVHLLTTSLTSRGTGADPDEVMVERLVQLLLLGLLPRGAAHPG